MVSDEVKRTGRALHVALSHVAAERERQESLKLAGRFKYSCADADMTDLGCLAVLTEEVGEVARELCDLPKIDTSKLRAELVQVAAVAVAWIEKLDKQP